MRFTPTIFGKLLEAIDRRQFAAVVARHDGDAYDKSFRSWDHLVALIYAQFSDLDSLRGLEAGWNANGQHHYHLGADRLSRSTLADANRRRPPGLFADAFALVAGQLDRRTRRDGQAMLRLIDSTPIPLGKLCAWAKSNGRIRGMKLHVVYDPDADLPRVLDITDANVNDAQIGRTVVLEAGATYVFDKGYCHYGWWRAIAAARSVFVTRPKSNMRLDVIEARPVDNPQGDGFRVLADERVALASKGDSKLPIPLRRVRVERDEGKPITLLTNDLTRSAVEIGALYKGRWQIELLFRWLKQNLKLRKFLGANDNAIRLQLYAAMIAFALLRIAAAAHKVRLPILRFTDLVGQCLFERRRIGAIERPPPTNPSKKRDRADPNQFSFSYL
ncbi:MAG: IS4 family transposase [Hyphomicrobiales bacterium]|nr:IS4 family transposase [Hyphomicrobiales bacterium]MBV8664104.1 IS4 family transposase [Hyphomicrobiales bacterium]